MQIEEYRFILQDIKSQIHQIPSLQSLLKLTQKTTKKLQCLNLYSQIDRRTFEIQIEEENIFKQISNLYKRIFSIQQNFKQQNIPALEQNINSIKQKNINTFDLLTKQEQILTRELKFVQKMLEEDEKKDQINQIKQLDQYDDDVLEINSNNFYSQNEKSISNPHHRINQLKQQIDQIQKRIVQINYGQGKWFDGDQKDFIRIYNRSAGSGKKIINDGIKILGMNQAQIMDHLQLYESYLQLEKQKKLASEQYKQIKFLQGQEKREGEIQKQQMRKLNQQIKKQKELIERLRKKQQIQFYKQKKQQQKQRMIQQEEQLKLKSKISPFETFKRKQIFERSKMHLQNQQKKLHSAKQPKQSIDKKQSSISHKRSSSKIKKSSNLNLQEVNLRLKNG